MNGQFRDPSLFEAWDRNSSLCLFTGASVSFRLTHLRHLQEHL